jgi:type IV pilus assembly protein PilA
MSWIRNQLKKDEGFTLIELMVVVLIIAILIAIAIPTFLGARERAQDRAAQSNLRNALTAEKVFYTDAEEYTVDFAALAAIEPSLNFAAAADATDVSVVGTAVCDAVLVPAVAGNNNAVGLTVIAASGNTWGMQDVAIGANSGTYYYNAAAACDGVGNGVTDGFPPAP